MSDTAMAPCSERGLGHDWEAGSWGVIVGASRCRVCGKVAQTSDFPVLVKERGDGR